MQVSVRNVLEERRIAIDRGGGDQSAGLGDTGGFGQRLLPVGRVGQVVERPEELHDVEAVVRLGQVARVAYDR